MLKFKNLRLRPLMAHLIVTLLYPVFRTIIAEDHRLLLFTNAITITGLVMIAGGVIYALFLHGDFDISAYFMKRGMEKEPKQTFRAYLMDVYEKREGAFNYPLFVGLVYIAAALILSYFFI
ncbi:MAG: hypothetical protein IKP32_07250 [Clostridia bacterium]|nr:hypothetical protein [Clostridia bacterium]